MFFMSFESQTSVCAFNCVQTPIFSGPVWRSRADKASVGDRCSNGPVPVCLSAWTQTRLLGRYHYKTAPKKWLKTYYKKGKNVELINTKSRTAKEFDFLQEFQQRPVAAEPFPAPQLYNRTTVSLTFLV